MSLWTEETHHFPKYETVGTHFQEYCLASHAALPDTLGACVTVYRNLGYVSCLMEKFGQSL